MADKVKGKRGKKPPSAARVAAEAAVEQAQKAADAAKSSQEKLVAATALKAKRDELKSLKFCEIVVPRVSRALKILEGVEKMANPNAYKWTPDQAGKITKALTQAVTTIENRLIKKGDQRQAFSL